MKKVEVLVKEVQEVVVETTYHIEIDDSEYDNFIKKLEGVEGHDIHELREISPNTFVSTSIDDCYDVFEEFTEFDYWLLEEK